MKEKIFFIILIIVIGIGIYANSFQNQMFWDDYDGILKNKFIQDWHYAPKYFSQNLIAGAGLASNYWRPILLITYSIEWKLWQDSVIGYHIVNTLLHIAGAILLFLILLYLFKNKLLASFTALIFLVHPLQTEAVTYVSGRGDPLSALFIFLSIWLYIVWRKSSNQKKNLFFISSILLYILALLSKETAIVLPGFIILVEVVLSAKNILITSIKNSWPYIAVMSFYMLMRITILNFNDGFNWHIDLFTFFKVVLKYFELLFWPNNLHMERSINVAASPWEPSVLFGGLIITGLITAAVLSFKKNKIVFFGIAWFFIALAPTSNILLPINGLLYEHWLYLPMIGIFLPVFWLIILIAKKHKAVMIISTVLFGLAVITLSTKTILRNQEWKDPITFYNQTLQYSPNSYRIINNLGLAYADTKEWDKAENAYTRAIAVDPWDPVAHYNIANLYYNTSKIDQAVEEYRRAIAIDPNFLFAYQMLSKLYLEQNQPDKAQAVLDEFTNK